MEFDRSTTVGAFVAIIVLATAALFLTPMQQDTILMMVLPSMVVFGAVFLWLGVKHGEYRAGPL